MKIIEKIKRLNRGNSKFIIRLDDACETMNRNKWIKIESILDSLDIKPIVAVIPNNQDKQLKIDRADKDFWNIVHLWQKKGWHIALHGYQHKYHKINRNKQIIPLYNRSEFAGLKINDQEKKLLKGLEIFKKYKIKTNIWVAPSHSFDKGTLLALRNQTTIQIISDGISLYPYREKGFTFIPQQLWEIKKYRLGIWTICLHPNNMSLKELDLFEKNIRDEFFEHKFLDINDIEKYIFNFNIISLIYKFISFTKIHIKNIIY